MSINTQLIAKQLQDQYGLESAVCKDLCTLANDAIEVTAQSGHYALKLYNPASRNKSEVQWEIDLTLHLIKNGAPVARPVAGNDGYLQSFIVNDQERVAVLFEWVAGAKPKPDLSTYVLVGKAAALIHQAADTFSSPLEREVYDAGVLINEQLKRMKQPLIETGQQQRVFDLTERLRTALDNPTLDWGICHMDLTLDNVHRDGDSLMVFDLDSAGECWRATEPWGVKKAAEDRFQAWLEGYRTIRPFSKADEDAVAVFAIIEDIRNTVWKLGFANSSRGKPLMQPAELPQVVDEWLEWEKNKVKNVLSD
ncbi:MAG TPA: phosphotransferase [Candidatus Saccharimonadales bacterium]|nr:phosphotransferase [Candidatus Saccharimonadales bacterium]